MINDYSAASFDLKNLDNLRLQMKENPKAGTKAVAQQFESMFVNMMLKSMREAVPQDGMFSSNENRMYTELMDQQLADKLTKQSSLGLADVMLRQLMPDATPASAAAELPIAMKNPAQSTLAEPLTGLRPERAGIALKPAVSAALAPLQRNAPAVSERPGDHRTKFETPKAAPDIAASVGAEKPPATAREFVQRIWPHAVKVAQELGIAPQLIVGHAVLESGWGKRDLKDASGASTFNLFGIKASPKSVDAVVAATTEYVNGVAHKVADKFRSYSSYAEAFSDYATLLKNNPRYAKALEAGDNVKGFATALQKAGYATDPHYAEKLSGVLNGKTFKSVVA